MHHPQARSQERVTVRTINDRLAVRRWSLTLVVALVAILSATVPIVG